uniref:Fibrinogen C-terminal domain-containing protein n=1 Tax=Biomphalaria glabrata TaxID=6526 RepID=A0A2C9LBH9_BIOGL
MIEVKSKNVKGEIYQNKLKDSYLQVTWTNLKLSDSGKYFCEAHSQFSEGSSEKSNEMLTITVQSPTFNDLVNVIQKIITQVDEDKDIRTQAMNIMRVGLERNYTSLTEIVNTNAQNIKNMRFTMNTNITSIKEDMDTTSQNIMSIIVDTNNTITMLKKDLDTNAGNIKILREDIDGNITKLKEDLDTNKQLQINLQENLRMEVANISTNLTELKNQMDEVKKLLQLYFVTPTSCRNVTSTKARVIVTLSSGLKVMCDTKTDGGGWIIIQRRINGKVDFYRGWQEYRDGFGDYNIGEFYLGNENIFNLTSTGQFDLRIDLEFKNKIYFAQYEDFIVLNETDKYRLEIGKYSGNAGDSLRRQNNMFFSTFDRENDIHKTKNCAKSFLGAWWYKDCHDSNLNGQWGSNSYAEGMNWYILTQWDDSVTFCEMKIRERE